MNDLNWLRTAISWLDRQGGFTQAVVSALVLAAGGLLWSLAVRGCRLVQRRYATGRQRKRELLHDFVSAPAEPGEVDHGVNTTASLETIQALLREALPPLTAIMQNLFKDTPDRLPDNCDVRKKQGILREAAKQIHPHVRALEDVARRIAPGTTAFMSAYRVLLARPELSMADKTALVRLRDTYSTGVADTFAQLSDLVSARRQDIARLDRKQQDLSRMVRRSTRALHDIEKSVRAVSKFCSGEMPSTINRLVQ
jgi:hypothetical protein